MVSGRHRRRWQSRGVRAARAGVDGGPVGCVIWLLDFSHVVHTSSSSFSDQRCSYLSTMSYPPPASWGWTLGMGCGQNRASIPNVAFSASALLDASPSPTHTSSSPLPPPPPQRTHTLPKRRLPRDHGLPKQGEELLGGAAGCFHSSTENKTRNGSPNPPPSR